MAKAAQTPFEVIADGFPHLADAINKLSDAEAKKYLLAMSVMFGYSGQVHCYCNDCFPAPEVLWQGVNEYTVYAQEAIDKDNHNRQQKRKFGPMNN